MADTRSSDTVTLIATVACVHCDAEFHIGGPTVEAFYEMSLRLAEHVATAHPAGEG